MNKEKQFIEQLLIWYQIHKRDLPWRKTTDPYYIVVSEIMSQQTQISRVLVKYDEWLTAFPTMEDLARAPQAEVLRLWKGLGYNSRALRLQKLAQVIVRDYHGKFPETYEELLTLPGIGPYTAGAVYVFGLGGSISFIDTNIKRIVHRVFEGNELQGWRLSDKEVAVLAERIYPRGKAYEYHQALMDLGASYCQAKKPNCVQCPVRGVCSTAKELIENPGILQEKRVPYKKSTQPFKETKRFLRGKVVDYLREYQEGSCEDIFHYINGFYSDYDQEKTREVLCDLVREGLIQQDGVLYHL